MYSAVWKVESLFSCNYRRIRSLLLVNCFHSLHFSSFPFCRTIDSKGPFGTSKVRTLQLFLRRLQNEIPITSAIAVKESLLRNIYTIFGIFLHQANTIIAETDPQKLKERLQVAQLEIQEYKVKLEKALQVGYSIELFWVWTM